MHESSFSRSNRRFTCVSACSALALLLVSSCSAVIGDASGTGDTPGGGSGTGSGTGAGTGSTGAGTSTGTGTSTGGAVGLGGPTDPIAKPASVLIPSSRFARLSHTQWTNAMLELLQLPNLGGLDDQLTKDAVPNFDNEGDRLYVQDALRADLERTAETLSQQIVGDKVALARLIPANAPTNLTDKAKAFINSFGLQAYRRPLTDAEVTEAMGLFNQGPALTAAGTDPFNAGVQVLLQFFLQSPHFLYREELSTAVADGKIALSDYEVATKVSFALTNKMPDDQLFKAAAAGQLHTADQLSTQATRLLAGNDGLGVVDHFHFQVLKLGGYDSIIKDTTLFPLFTATAAASMREETTAFVEWIFTQNLGVKELFTTPTSFVNSDVAPIYGLSGNFTTTPSQVPLDPTQRAGLLTQPGFLSLHAYQTDVDSIHRGVFVNQRILCVDLPPPAPNATPLPPAVGVSTNRQRVEAHTGVGTCGESCHGRWINPAGFAFEEFDAIGKFRTTDEGLPIDSSDTYRFVVGDGEVAASYKNAVEFSALLGESQQAHSCYTQQWMSYLFARQVDAAMQDKPIIDYLTQQSVSGKISVKDLLQTLASTDNFLSRLPGVQ